MIKYNVECLCVKTHKKDGSTIKKGKIYTITIDKQLYNKVVDSIKNECLSIELINAYEFEIEKKTKEGLVKSIISGNLFYKKTMFNKYFICGSKLRKYKLESIFNNQIKIK